LDIWTSCITIWHQIMVKVMFTSLPVRSILRSKLKYVWFKWANLKFYGNDWTFGRRRDSKKVGCLRQPATEVTFELAVGTARTLVGPSESNKYPIVYIRNICSDVTPESRNDIPFVRIWQQGIISANLNLNWSIF
jgi:hypothetical protein